MQLHANVLKKIKYSIMKEELLRITDADNGKKVTSARELHSFLEVTERFSSWMERMFKYGFTQGVDYTPLTFLHPQNKQETTDYALTLDTAKEISMIQRSEKGKQARQYFIECERKANALIKSMSPSEILLFQAQRLVNFEKEQEQMKEQIKLIEAKMITRPNYFTVMGYSVYNKKSVGRDLAANIGRKASALCRQRGLAVDRVSDPRFGLVGSYPTHVLDEIFNLLEIK